MTHEEIKVGEAFMDFLADYHKDDLIAMSLKTTDARMLVVKFTELQLRSPDLATMLLERPNFFITAATRAFRSVLAETLSHKEAEDYFLTFVNIPSSETISIDNISAEHLGRLITIEGVVRRATDIIPICIEAVYQCGGCGEKVEAHPTKESMFQPGKCLLCGASGKWSVDEENTTYEDRQRLVVQESPEGTRGKAKPGEIQVLLPRWMVRVCDPGDYVRFTGVLHTKQKAKNSVEFTMFFEPINYEIHEKDYEEIDITPADEERIKRIAASGDPIEAITDSFMPSIYGLQTEKEALILSLFGGVTRINKDGSRQRGDIHILMVGDPGTAKSKLLYGLRPIAPRAVLASGKGASAAGLTATVTKDEFSDGEWTLEAGAMVIADNGVFILDEMDKMDKKDTSAMHQAMEQQEVSIAKAGINATLKTRCPVLAAANPKMGRYDNHEELAPQINMPPALLSRFDVIFPMLDKPNRERDAAIANHILRGGRNSEPLLETEFVRKFIAYAKRAEPEVSEEAMKMLLDYYVGLRNHPNVENITARQLESIRRLTEAAARARLKPVAGIEEAEVALRIHRYYMEVAGCDLESGKFDMGNMSGAGRTRTQMDRITTIRTIIDTLAGVVDVTTNKPVGFAKEEAIVQAAILRGLTKEQAEKDIITLRRNGEIMQVGVDGFVRI